MNGKITLTFEPDGETLDHLIHARRAIQADWAYSALFDLVWNLPRRMESEGYEPAAVAFVQDYIARAVEGIDEELIDG